MNSTEAIVLGIIQGLTEFLPVSSSGHLVLFQQIFGLKEAELFFYVFVHLGTLVAVILVFRREIGNIIAALLRLVSLAGQKDRFRQRVDSDPDAKMALLIIIGSIPTAILGLMFHNIADRLFSAPFFTGLMLVVTGSLLWLTRRVRPDGEKTGLTGFSRTKAFFIGLVQGLAIIPGISRSGSTISMGLLLGINRETAARYSFLLSIPAIVGAGLLSLKDGLSQMDPVIRLSLLGAVSAALVGYGALKVLLRIVKTGHLYVFAPYCWLVGILAIILSW
jgi:undecaprenyl-diphosphatase